jgi:hypothetical protein
MSLLVEIVRIFTMVRQDATNGGVRIPHKLLRLPVGASHSFDPNTLIGGDVAWIYSRQFQPLLVSYNNIP